MARTGNPKGRPPSQLDEKHFETLCQYQFTQEEMAAALKVSLRTLKRKIKDEPFKTLWEDGAASGRAFLKRRGYEYAARDDAVGVRAWEHLTKHVLGWTDKHGVELTGKNGGPVQTIDLSKLSNDQIDQLERIATALAAAGGAAGGYPAGEGEAGG